MSNPSKTRKVVDYPAFFEPSSDDRSLQEPLVIPGNRMLHENSELCWCEPEISHYDEDLGIWVCEHRWTIN